PLSFFTDAATTSTYTLSLHDALPIYLHHLPRPKPELLIVARAAPPLKYSPWNCCPRGSTPTLRNSGPTTRPSLHSSASSTNASRSEEHTSELQSRENLVCRLLLEKKK